MTDQPRFVPEPMPFAIGDRVYHVSRHDHGWRIASNGDLVHHISTLHYGEVGAFLRIAEALSDIEAEWVARQP